MANTIASPKSFLEERNLSCKQPAGYESQARQRLQESEFSKSMLEICSSINAQAGTVVVDQHHYLPPEPVISSFAFSRGPAEYVMRLELCDRKPSLVFVTRKWRDFSASGVFRWLYWLANVEPLHVSFKYSCEIDEASASIEEIEKCFRFLLSGFARRHRPSFRRSSNHTRSIFRF
ncbi:MAG TPA: hypothetical protein VFI38_05450 [Candidatus Acidoferrum sp.]|nr:hypothetical protein [Candidatus Acidoferrum sp.]